MTISVQAQTVIIIIESDIDDVFQSIYAAIITDIQKYLGVEGSSQIID